MPPFIKNTNDILDDVPDLEPIVELEKLRPGEKQEEYKMKVVWRNVILMLALHFSAIYGLYLCFVSAKWQTTLAGMFPLLVLSFLLILLIPHSLYFLPNEWSWNYRWLSSSMGSPIVQGSIATPNSARFLPNYGFSS